MTILDTIAVQKSNYKIIGAIFGVELYNWDKVEFFIVPVFLLFPCKISGRWHWFGKHEILYIRITRFLAYETEHPIVKEVCWWDHIKDFNECIAHVEKEMNLHRMENIRKKGISIQ